ncbi:unnamed protein product [Laminaria digitata]
MELGSCIRSLLDWPQDVDEIANQFDAGSFALPMSWLVTQAVHIALYGFFYRTRAENGQGGGSENEEVDVRLAASLFLLAYAVLCSMLAARVIGGTVAAATVAGATATGGTTAGGGAHDDVTGGGAESDSRQSDLVLRAVEAGGPFTAALSSDAARSSSSPRGDRSRGARSRAGGDGHGSGGAASRRAVPAGAEGSTPDGEGDGRGGGASVMAAALGAAGGGGAGASRARRNSLRRGIKAYMRLTVGMMVGWAYNLWGQVEFRQKELEFRFGPALGATVYAFLSTALGVCIMVRGADKLDGRRNDRDARITVLEDRGLDDDYAARTKEDAGGEGGQGYEDAVRAFHARRMLVVVGGVGLMAGWAWEEAIDFTLGALVGDSADAGMIAAKLALAVISTTVVLGRELRADHHDHHHHGEGGGGGGGHRHGQDVGDGSSGIMGEVGNELSEPLMATPRRRDGVQ